MYCESSGYSKATGINKDGSRDQGLFQFNERTERWLEKDIYKKDLDMYDPETNVKVPDGCLIMMDGIIGIVPNIVGVDMSRTRRDKNSRYLCTECDMWKKRGTIFRGFRFICSDCDLTYWSNRRNGLTMGEYIMQISVQKVPKNVYSDWILNKHYKKRMCHITCLVCILME